ncbi:MAG: methyltransferase domain-containing protein [Anaerolineales bacterium]|jgi:ubiquinone/menaquinone biosynthesis C-methylase UbiE
MLPIQEWHKRFMQQAEWTRDIRQYLFNKAHLENAQSILDVGCGTGAITREIPNNSIIHGLDLEMDRLRFAQSDLNYVSLLCADGHHLPYPENSFSTVLCHFLLLWVISPKIVIREMIRVCKPGGYILLLAEPDYGGRIDYPNDLQLLGESQTESLRKQGAEPNTGRELAKWLYEEGVNDIEVGILGAQWKGKPSHDTWKSEWQILEFDLGDSLTKDDIREYKEIDKAAWEDGSRILFIPTFYAIGII